MEKKNIRWEIGKVATQSGIVKVKNKRLKGYMSRKQSLRPVIAAAKLGTLSKIAAQRNYLYDEVLLTRALRKAKVCFRCPI